MAYVSRTNVAALQAGRHVRTLSAQNDGLFAVAEVERSVPGDTELTQAEYDAALVAIEAFNAANPPPAPPPPPPSLAVATLDVIDAILAEMSFTQSATARVEPSLAVLRRLAGR